jgi:hypothetical protein
MVPINTERDEMLPEFPTHNFDHVVLAIRLPNSEPPLHLDAEIHDSQLGRMLIFDPTSSYVPVGQLPSYLQANYGFLAREGGGQLLALPLVSAESSRRTRMGKFALTPSRTLSGEISEISTGNQAAEVRPLWQFEPTAERTKRVENFLAHFLPQLSLTSYDVQNLSDINRDIAVHYAFGSEGFARPAGNFIVVRPCVLGRYSQSMMEKTEPHEFPVDFDHTGIDEDDYSIGLPPGYSADDMPDPVDLSEDFAEYHSHINLSAGALHYRRTLTTKKLTVPVNELPQLKEFYRKIAIDESSGVLLRPGS